MKEAISMKKTYFLKNKKIKNENKSLKYYEHS
jgi:hypothetical protein